MVRSEIKRRSLSRVSSFESFKIKQKVDLEKARIQFKKTFDNLLNSPETIKDPRNLSKLALDIQFLYYQCQKSQKHTTLRKYASSISALLTTTPSEQDPDTLSLLEAAKNYSEQVASLSDLYLSVKAWHKKIAFK